MVLRVVVVLTFVVLGLRIYQIQFFQDEQFISQANENRLDTVSIPATRGIITDRNGQQLAVNVASANVVVTPAFLPEDETEELEVLQQLAGLVDMPLSGPLVPGCPEESVLCYVRQEGEITPFQPVTIRSDIDYDIARLIIGEDLPGVDIEWQSVRAYPSGALTSHVIGYMGPIPESVAEEYEARGYVLDRDRIGYDGLEFVLEGELAGNPGIQRVERDVAGQVIRTIQEVQPVQSGNNVQLTIDLDLQQRAQELLIETLEGLRDNPRYVDNPIGFDRGVVIATDPRTGEVLAMVSWPTYDNTNFARGIDYPYYLRVSQDPKRPLFNQAVGSLYPPGSIFKMITATAALEEGIVVPEDEFFDPGEIQLVNRYYPNDPGQSQTFVCWLDEGHQNVNLIESLAFSCDVYYYKVGGGFENEVEGNGVNITRLKDWMDLYGLGQPTGVELPGDISIGQIAVLPDETWKRRVWGESWSTGDTYNASFGQGYVTATPMQMLHTLNILANDGLVVEPTLIREVTDADGVVVQGFEPRISDREELVDGYLPASPETIALMQEGMRAAVTLDNEGGQFDGTAVDSQVMLDELGDQLGVTITTAGKTGTAEFCDNIAAALEQCQPGFWPAHAWYMGYAPYENPEISVIAFIYNGQEGSGWALPLATAVMEEYFLLKAERSAAP
jgi:penicillin-binding protein 2